MNNGNTGIGTGAKLHEALVPGSRSLDSDLKGVFVYKSGGWARGTLRSGSIVVDRMGEHAERGLLNVYSGVFDDDAGMNDSRVNDGGVFVPSASSPAYDSSEYWALQRLLQSLETAAIDAQA